MHINNKKKHQMDIPCNECFENFFRKMHIYLDMLHKNGNEKKNTLRAPIELDKIQNRKLLRGREKRTHEQEEPRIKISSDTMILMSMIRDRKSSKNHLYIQQTQ